MKYKIVYDGVGRIRFRCGQYAFSQEDESRIEAFLMKQSYIESVKASYANGGILVMYKGQHKSGIISAIAAMDVKKLPACENGSGYSVGMIEKKFRKDIIKIVAKRIVYRLFLPAPLRTVITAVKAAGFILKGIYELMAGRLTVEVLDAASITACLAQRDYKTAGSVMFLLSVSSLLESYTKAKTKAALTDSLMIRTDKLWKVDDDGERQVSMSELEPGDRIRIQTGSIIPVDGEVTDGQAEVNEASMTGEAMPVSKTQGSSVFAGTVVENGNIVIKIRALSGNTRISQIAELISRSDSLKANLQGKAERLAMSDASDIARETADITLRSCDSGELIRLRTISSRLMQRIESNYRFILAFNSALMALGFFGVITPGVSALLHNTSTMLICMKSMTPLLGDGK